MVKVVHIHVWNGTMKPAETILRKGWGGKGERGSDSKLCCKYFCECHNVHSVQV
jgi:hypothetical protein